MSCFIVKLCSHIKVLPFRLEAEKQRKKIPLNKSFLKGILFENIQNLKLCSKNCKCQINVKIKNYFLF